MVAVRPAAGPLRERVETERGNVILDPTTKHTTACARAIITLAGLATLACAASASAAASADGLWQTVSAQAITTDTRQPWVTPLVFQRVTLNKSTLQGVLSQTPLESAITAKKRAMQIALPLPDGRFAQFEMAESPVMEPELAAKFPEIRTYCGQGIDDPTATVRIDWTPAGFHAQVLAAEGTFYIDPLYQGDTGTYASYYKRDYRKQGDAWQCLLETDPAAPKLTTEVPVILSTGPTLRTYRLACAATGEYTAFHGGTVAGGLAAIVTTVNRVTGVYEREVAVRLVLVANNNLLVYTNAASDPYTNGNGSTMLGQNQSNINTVIGSANYDIGHVVSTGGGGLAYLGAVCKLLTKARGVTGSPSPVGDAFDIDYVAHEMGHQFGGNHPFNGALGNCSGANRNGATAYEPGSGTTIMAYAGICGNDDLQPHSDAYFHSISFDEITTYLASTACAVSTATSNNPPVVAAGSDYTIPKQTPFTLTAAGSDPNGDVLTYCWEQRDLGAQATVTAPDDGFIPLFRSFNPSLSPSRTFPQWSDILNNVSTKGEQLPTTNRTLHFRVTARDNRAGGGGVNTDDMQAVVTTAAGPFTVTQPNTSAERSGMETVNWAVAGTNLAPVSAAAVDILLSLDGGATFPVTLAANTPNDGAEPVLLPNVSSTTARVMVRAVGNVFFDVSNVNFTIATVFAFDYDNDGDVDPTDYDVFQACLTGPGMTGPPPGCTLDAFGRSDADDDGDADQVDFGVFQRCYSGSGFALDPACDD